MSSKRRLTVTPATLSLAGAVAVVLALAALVGAVGADSRWLAALGHLILTHHSVPSGVPFASAANSHWPNVPVLAEIVFSWLVRAGGDRALMAVQLIAVALALGALIGDALTGGAKPAGVSRGLLVACLGSIPALAIARSQLFSLALFPLLCWLLRAEARAPSKRIWLVVPLIALWSNLHGAVLVGLCLLAAYLLLHRLRAQPVVAMAVGVASAAAVCATPALLGSVSYYHDLLSNQAAASGQGMWASLSLTSPLDLLFIGSAIVLAVQFIRGRPAGWERAAAVGLAVASVLAARSGIWLALFLVPAAARSFAVSRQWAALTGPAIALASGVLVFALVRGPVLRGAGAPLLSQAISAAHGSPVLAGGGIEEQVALAGGRIVVGDPIDAFPAATQTAYLDWLSGSRRALSRLDSDVHVVLVPRGTSAQRLMARVRSFAVAGGDRRVLLYERRN